MTDQRSQLAQGFRELADCIERLDPKILPYAPLINIFAENREEMASFARAAAPVEKDAQGDSWFFLRKTFTGNVTLECNIARNKVCQRVVVGTRTVEARPETLLPATEAHEEPIYEWECSSILADKGGK